MDVSCDEAATLRQRTAARWVNAIAIGSGVLGVTGVVYVIVAVAAGFSPGTWLGRFVDLSRYVFFVCASYGFWRRDRRAPGLLLLLLAFEVYHGGRSFSWGYAAGVGQEPSVWVSAVFWVAGAVVWWLVYRCLRSPLVKEILTSGSRHSRDIYHE